MHFLMAEDLVHERETELHHGARNRPPGRANPRRRTGSRRQQLGWTLVEVGLRLATEPEEPGVSTR